MNHDRYNHSSINTALIIIKRFVSKGVRRGSNMLNFNHQIVIGHFVVVE